MINNVNLMGRIVADPELHNTNGGNSVTSFRIAIDRDFKNKDGNYEADFITIIAWRNTAEFICRYFGKGSLIAIQGHIQTRNYEANDGTKRFATEVVADKVSFTGERRDNNGSGQQNNFDYNQPQQTQQQGYNNTNPQQNQQNGGYQNNRNNNQSQNGYNNGNSQQGGYQNNGYNNQPSAPAPQQSAPPQNYNNGYQQQPNNMPDYAELDDDDLPF